MPEPIMPTPGRIVWYRGADKVVRAAVVTQVHGVWSVNLFVYGTDGNDREQGYRTSVTHADPALEPGCVPSWDWMPFQKGQAAKTEAAEAKLAEAKIH